MVRTDTLTKDQRQKAMRAIKSADTVIEISLRRSLWNKGYRYRKNYTKLAGKPDIVFVSPKIAVFCDSEFWHGYDWQNAKKKIKSKREYWWPKIEKNMERDLKVNETLKNGGWIVIRFWGKEIANELERCVSKIEDAINKRTIGIR